MPEAPEIWTPPYYGHTAVVPTVSALEDFTLVLEKRSCEDMKSFLHRSLYRNVQAVIS